MSSSSVHKYKSISLLGVEYTQIDPEYFSSGDIFWVPKSGLQDSLAYILVEQFSKDRFLGLINILGHKAGRKLVSFPNECLYESNHHCLSKSWLIKNWDKWVALGDYENAIFLRSSNKLTK